MPRTELCTTPPIDVNWKPSISFIFATNDNSTVPPGTSIYAHSADALGFVDLPRLFGNSTTRIFEEVYANVSQWADMQAPAGANIEAMEKVLEVEARSVVEDGSTRGLISNRRQG